MITAIEPGATPSASTRRWRTLAQRLDRLAVDLGGDELDLAAVAAAGHGRQPALGERHDQVVDRLGVAAVEVERVLGQPQLPGLVVTEDRLRRIVEDVQDVLASAVQQPLERRQPAAVEVLPLVHDDRVVARPELADRLIQPLRQRPLEPLGGHRLRLVGQRAGLAREVLGQLVERPDVQLPARPLRDLARLVREHPRERPS